MLKITFNKHKWLILGLTLFLSLLTTFYVASLPSIYRSTAILLIGVEHNKEINSSQSNNYYQTQLKILGARMLAEKLIDKLNLATHPAIAGKTIVETLMKGLNMTLVPNSQLVEISFESTDAQLAAQIPNTLVELYIENTLKTKLAMIKKASSQLTKHIEALRNNLIKSEMALLTYKENHAPVDQKESQLKIKILQEEVDSNNKLYQKWVLRLQTLQEPQTTVGRLIEPASVSAIPYKPQKKWIVAISLILALFFSTLLAFFLELMDKSLKTPEEVEKKLGLPLLTVLPKVKIDKTEDKIKARWMFLREPKSGYSESIRTARTGILLSKLDTQHKVLIVTSSIPNEGKTTFAINIAVALGDMEKTLLIDADLRLPSLAKSLGLSDDTPGLSELITGERDLDECIHDHLSDNRRNLDIMPSGMAPPNPLELLSSPRFGELLYELSQEYEYIIIDSAPTIAVSDTLVLTKYASSVLYVVKANATSYKLILEGLKRLRQVKAPVHNIILNQLDSDNPSKYYRYGYGYGYGKND
ncbi:hypothetical protein PN36_19395 [Candidatus Thiomargarita nelsonii]|uniref:non-specific protein-tyrosine kinase n=1 Tax=Candidatus Thiomargarita nelsonii TaxID=1003181 RepID=A0A0A6PN53_9GAMM|nr:hypothetical protein PN36_19395 [Candidatus Thiomargarita nelsonii]